MKIIKVFIIVISFLFLSVNLVQARCSNTSTSGFVVVCSSITDSEACRNTAGCVWSGEASGGTVGIDNPLGNATPESIIGNVINAVLGISGSLALLMFVYGGFTWMLSGGSPEKVTKGKNTLVWATIGLVVIFSSYALVNFVFKGLGSATG